MSSFSPPTSSSHPSPLSFPSPSPSAAFSSPLLSPLRPLLSSLSSLWFLEFRLSESHLRMDRIQFLHFIPSTLSTSTTFSPTLITAKTSLPSPSPSSPFHFPSIDILSPREKFPSRFTDEEVEWRSGLTNFISKFTRRNPNPNTRSSPSLSAHISSDKQSSESPSSSSTSRTLPIYHPPVSPPHPHTFLYHFLSISRGSTIEIIRDLRRIFKNNDHQVRQIALNFLVEKNLKMELERKEKEKNLHIHNTNNVANNKNDSNNNKNNESENKSDNNVVDVVEPLIESLFLLCLHTLLFSLLRISFSHTQLQILVEDTKQISEIACQCDSKSRKIFFSENYDFDVEKRENNVKFSEKFKESAKQFYDLQARSWWKENQNYDKNEEDEKEEKGGRKENTEKHISPTTPKDTSPFSSHHFSCSPSLFMGHFRSLCSKCQKSCNLYCPYDLQWVVPPSFLSSLPSPLPRVTLPVNIDILHHPGENIRKSTSIHSCVIAPKQCKLYEFPDFIPKYISPFDTTYTHPLSSSSPPPLRAVVLYPTDDSLSLDNPSLPVENIDTVIVIESTWQKGDSVARHPHLSSLPKIRIHNVESTYWRYQERGRNFLCTLEAIYYVCKEIQKRKKEGENFDDLMIIYAAQHEMIRKRYGETEEGEDGEEKEKKEGEREKHYNSEKLKVKRTAPRSWQPRFADNHNGNKDK